MTAGDSERKLIIEWYDQYSIQIYKYIAKMINDTYQAEDLTQDTFVKAYQYLVNKEVDYPKTFLFRTAHNITVDYIRKQSPIHLMKNIFPNRKDSKASIESVMEGREDLKIVYKALSRLKASYRQVIILRRIEEFSIKETAQILGWSENKVKSTLFRASKTLKKQLDSGGLINERPEGNSL